MTNVKLIKLKFKEGNKETWLNWCEQLKHRKPEVIETLKNEGILSESCFLSEDEQCIYYFMEAEDFEKAKAAVNKGNFKIDSEHQEKST